MDFRNDNRPFKVNRKLRISIALFIAGSAISLLSCVEAGKTEEHNDEKLISRTVNDMENVSSENGLRKNLLRSALVEEHAFAKAPYTEHPEGIEIIGYDSLGVTPSSSIVADYALHWMERDLWDLKGNVVATGDEGQKVYTQQLMYDRKLGKIYSNVDARVVDGRNNYLVEGFEADDSFERWSYRRLKGTISVDTAPKEQVAGESGEDVADGNIENAVGEQVGEAASDDAAPTPEAAGDAGNDETTEPAPYEGVADSLTTSP